MLVVMMVLFALIGGTVWLLATGGTTEPERVPPDEWILSERSRFFLWGERVAEVKNPSRDIVYAYVVNHEPRESFIKTAEACARTELARFSEATCYAFRSEEAIEFGGIPADGGESAVSCWVASARSSRAPSGEISVESVDNPVVDPSCPV